MDLSTFQDEQSGTIKPARHEIVKMLQLEGFNVHGVISPPDIGYFLEKQKTQSTKTSGHPTI